jgi:hypothetical protein
MSSCPTSPRLPNLGFTLADLNAWLGITLTSGGALSRIEETEEHLDMSPTTGFSTEPHDPESPQPIEACSIGSDSGVEDDGDSDLVSLCSEGSWFETRSIHGRR